MENDEKVKEERSTSCHPKRQKIEKYGPEERGRATENKEQASKQAGDKESAANR